MDPLPSAVPLLRSLEMSPELTATTSQGYGAIPAAAPTPTPKSFRSFRGRDVVEGEGRLVKRVSETRGLGGATVRGRIGGDEFTDEDRPFYATYRSTPNTPHRQHHIRRSPSTINTGRGNLFRTISRKASSVFLRSAREGRAYDEDLLGDDDENDEVDERVNQDDDGGERQETQPHTAPNYRAGITHSRRTSGYARSWFLGDRHGPNGQGDENSIASSIQRRRDIEVPQDGIRVWYSSYDTIDWLHDQIKDSRRVKRLRDRANTHGLRGKIVNAADRATGWLVVSLIGIMTALMAYGVIRTETFFFGFKTGYCSSRVFATREQCGHGGWVAWRSIFSSTGDAYTRDRSGLFAGWKAFTMYTAIALILAWISCIMTVYLTASTRFEDPQVARPPAKSNPQNGVGDALRPERNTRLSAETLKSETTPLLPALGDSGEHLSPISIPIPVVDAVPEPPAPEAKRVLYFAAGSGIPEIKTILSGFVIKGYLGSVVLFVKSFGLAFSVASGMSLDASSLLALDPLMADLTGKEGPMVHIACCVGNIVSRQFRKYELNESKKREILSAACAAGVSVAFGAPLGGTLFSWEESSYYFPAKTMWRSFFCAAVAALTLRLLNPYENGRLVLLEVDYSKDHHSNFIYLIAVLLGVLGGIYGAVWAKLNIAWSKRVRAGTWVKRHPIVEVLMISIVTSLASYHSPLTRIGGVEYVAELFAECHDHVSGFCSRVPSDILSNIGKLAHSVVIRAGLACITFGIRVPAGIFVPSLAAGAAFGRMVGLLLEYLTMLYPDSPVLPHRKHIIPGVYALVGASATLAGVTRTTISLVVIVVELTSTLDYVVPVALTVLIAKTVADALESDGIYDLVINMNSFPFLDSKKDHHFDRRDAVEIADVNLPYLRVDDYHTVASLHKQVDNLKALGYSDGSFPCLTSQGSHRDQQLHVVGILALNELQHVLGELSKEPDATCNLSPSRSQMCGLETEGHHSIGDIADNPYDLVPYIDLASHLLFFSNSPPETHIMSTNFG
ncbi:hypothetical protein QFC22_001517 [Naganishia vaughanmartiniae]|uniref:Uncharacterized protein n=1 Tax=Naganishia vaughanmartiniae TaxID=1424756 RepID=A0ACC2XI50_9TREE|nr:hypothetical protein QFC22_001517 [Naganishia vaughanmartiniae]